MSQEFETADFSDRLELNKTVGKNPLFSSIKGVSFDESKITPPSSNSKQRPTITKLITKTGLVKNEKEAAIILLILVIIIFILTIIIWPSESSNPLAPDQEAQKRAVEQSMKGPASL
jgi:hypothetical protein